MDVKKRLFRFLATAGLSAVALLAGCRRNEAALETALPDKDAPPIGTSSQPYEPESVPRPEIAATESDKSPPPVVSQIESPAETAASVKSADRPQTPSVIASDITAKQSVYTPPIIAADDEWPLMGIARPYTGELQKPKAPATVRPQPQPKPVPVPVIPKPDPILPPQKPASFIKPEPEPEPVTPQKEEEILAGPFFEIETPLSGSYYSEEIILKGKVSNSSEQTDETDNVLGLYWAPEDDPENIRYILFNEDGTFTSFIDASRFSGALRLVFTAEDMQHNKSIRSITLKDGRIPPQINLETPKQGDSYGPAFYISGTVSDPYAADPAFGEIEKVEYTLSSLLYQENEEDLTGSVVPGSDGTFSFAVDSSSLQGVQQLEVRAVGNNGVSTLAALTLNQGEAVINKFTAVPADSSALVSWLELPFVDKYTITWTPYSGGVQTGPSLSATAASSPARLEPLENGLNYQIRVDTEINGKLISSRSIQLLPLTAEDLRPSLVPDYQRITVQWKPVPGAGAYDVLRSTNPDGTNAEILATGIEESSFIDYTSEFGTTYYYAVQPSDTISICSLFSAAESLESPVQKLEVVNRTPQFTKGRLFSLGGYIYYADTDGGLNIIDVSLPGSLTPVGSIETEGASGLTVSKDYAFLAERERGYKIINISDPRSPYEVNRTKTSNAMDAAWFNDVLYIADGETGLKVFDVSDPLYPSEAYRVLLPETRKVLVSGETLFVLTAENLRIYSCQNPLRPEELSVLPLKNPEDIALSENGSTVYIIQNRTALIIADVQDSTTPQLLTSIDLPGALNIDVQRDFAFISLGDQGFQVIDVRDPASPYLFDQEKMSSVTDLALNGTTLFTCGAEGIQRYSAYLYGNSYETAQIKLDNVVHSLTLTGKTLYAAKNEAGMSAVSLESADFSAVSEVPFWRGYASDSLQLSDYTLVAAGKDGVAVFSSKENTGSPVFIAATENSAVRIADAGNGFIAVLKEDSGIGFYNSRDFSVPESGGLAVLPAEPAAFIPLEDPRDLLVHGNILIAADNNLGLLTFDISSCDKPELLFPLKVPHVKTLTSINDLIAAGGADGIEIVQLEDNGSLTTLYSLDIPMVEGLTSDSSYIYVAQGVNGIKVIDPFAQRGPRVVSESPWIYSTDIVIDGSTAYSASGNIIRKVHIVVPPWLKSRD